MRKLPLNAPGYHRCQYCQNAVVDATPRVTGIQNLLSRVSFSKQGNQKTSWPVLELSVSGARMAYEAGCVLLQLFGPHLLPALDFSAVKLSDKSVQVSVEYMSTGLLSREPSCSLIITSKPSKTKLGEDSFFNPTEMFAPQGSLASKWIPTAPNSDFCSKPSLEFVQKCLLDCLENHARCNQTANSQYPSRLLDLDSPSSGQDSVFLTTPKGRPPFAALSYCWGGDIGFKTKESTIAKAQAGLSLVELPQTIQDAVFVCRGVGLHCLWVDRLCIVHDREVDFAAEMNRMGDIYSQARITIVAGNSATSEEGFLNPQLPHMPRSLQLPFNCPTGEGSKVVISPRPQEIEVVNSRGWTLQESLLSQRLVFYGSRQLEWTCRTLSKADGGHPSPYLVGLSRHESAHFSNSIWEAGEKHDLVWRTWIQLVKHYTQRNLSHLSDRLIAISALAKKANDAFQDKYLAGLWRGDLLRQLQWRPQRPWIAQPDEIYIAPSWSWASLEGEIDWYVPKSSEIEGEIKIISCTVVPVSPVAPYGALSGGDLIIRGRAISGQFGLDNNWSMKTMMFGTLFEFKFYPDTDEFLFKGLDDVHKVICFTLLPISKDENWNRTYRGLVLQENQDKETYRRIGVFIGPLWKEDETVFRDILYLRGLSDITIV